MEKEVKVNGISVLLLRIMLSGIFIVAGISHLVQPEVVTQRIQNAAFGEFALLFGNPHFLGLLSGYVLLIFGLTFLFGIFTRWSAIVLFFTLITITITIQIGNGWMHGPLWKNVALFGGLLFFIINKPKSTCPFTKKIITLKSI